MDVKQKVLDAGSKSPTSGFVQAIKDPRRSQVRKYMFLIHRWVGAVVAVYILVMSVTGVSLVFHDELSDALCTQPKIKTGSERLPLSRVVDGFQKKYSDYKVTGLIVSRKEGCPVDVFAVDSRDQRIDCLVDPFTAQVLGPRTSNPQLEFLRDVHHNLLSGKTGRTVNGVGAICLFILALTGVVIWWRGVKNWLAGFRISITGSARRINWSLHTVLGAWSLPFLLIMSISGFYFGFTAFFEKSLNYVFAVSSQRPLDEPTVAPTTDSMPGSKNRTSIDQLIANAKLRAPNTAVVERIAWPDNRRPAMRIWLSDSSTADDNASKTQVFLDPVTGSVLAVSTSGRPPAGDLVLQWLIRLHFGTFFGAVSKTLWLFLGLIPAILSISGLVLFWTGIKRRRP